MQFFGNPRVMGVLHILASNTATICLLILWKLLKRSIFVCLWLDLPELLLMLIFLFKIINLHYLYVSAWKKTQVEVIRFPRVEALLGSALTWTHWIWFENSPWGFSPNRLLSLAAFASKQQTTYLQETLTSLTPSWVKIVCVASWLTFVDVTYDGAS